MTPPLARTHGRFVFSRRRPQRILSLPEPRSLLPGSPERFLCRTRRRHRRLELLLQQCDLLVQGDLHAPVLRPEALQGAGVLLLLLLQLVAKGRGDLLQLGLRRLCSLVGRVLVRLQRWECTALYNT